MMSNRLVMIILVTWFSFAAPYAIGDCGSYSDWLITTPQAGAQYDVGVGEVDGEGTGAAGATFIFRIRMDGVILATDSGVVDAEEPVWMASAVRTTPFLDGRAQAEVVCSNTVYDAKNIYFNIVE